MTKPKLLLAAAACLMCTLPAFGDTYRIDFSVVIGTAGGTVTTIGPNFKGTDITISQMAYFKNGVQIGATHAVTGTCDGIGINDVGCLNFNTTGAGTISIVGDVLGLGSLTLLSGTISGFEALGATFSAIGPDTKHPALLAALGIPSNLDFNYDNTEIYISGSPSDNVLFANVVNTAVPDGGMTAMLLGGVLVGIEVLRRKARA